jgi:hypothetical protein
MTQDQRATHRYPDYRSGFQFMLNKISDYARVLAGFVTIIELMLGLGYYFIEGSRIKLNEIYSKNIIFTVQYPTSSLKYIFSTLLLLYSIILVLSSPLLSSTLFL